MGRDPVNALSASQGGGGASGRGLLRRACVLRVARWHPGVRTCRRVLSGGGSTVGRVTVALSTERLWLDPLDPVRDAVDLHVAFTDPEVTTFKSPVSRDVQHSVDRLTEMVRNNDYWVVREAPDGPGIGFVGLIGGNGLDWLLSRGVWGRGYATEAATAVIDHAFRQPGVDRVEAWVDGANSRSLALARRVGLTERGQMPQSGPGTRVVLGKSREPVPTFVINLVAELEVDDVAASMGLFETLFQFRAAIVVGDPPTYASLDIGPWSGSRRLDLVAAEGKPITPSSLTVELANDLDAVHARAMAAGLRIAEPVTDRPWGRREFVLVLPEGHEITVSGPIGT
ncbi:GNAT family N-acetyltransferase [Pseudonocardiaceae bacterium YIM PH 21723]|nr:GNAT family N-acetyltransferase [Pseudonocardiaceae bacterium YIM PH 21723]